MKKIIPYKKEVIFKTNINEITSISLEHHLTIENLNLNGEFIVSGEYKISDNSKTLENFNLQLPFEMILDEIYDTSKAIVDIDDFYYEIIDEKILSISIDVLVDKLSEILIKEELPVQDKQIDIIEELFEEQNNETKEAIIEENKIDRCIEEDDILPGEKEIIKMEENNIHEKIDKKDLNNKINSLFSNIGEENMYVSYNVYIIREGDTIEEIISKYNVSEEELKKYNDLSDLKLGDKIIIPNNETIK